MHEWCDPPFTGSSCQGLGYIEGVVMSIVIDARFQDEWLSFLKLFYYTYIHIPTDVCTHMHVHFFLTIHTFMEFYPFGHYLG